MISMKLKSRGSGCELESCIYGSKADITQELSHVGDGVAKLLDEMIDKKKLPAAIYDVVATTIIDTLVSRSPDGCLVRQLYAREDAIAMLERKLDAELSAMDEDEAVPDEEVPSCDPIAPKAECVGCKHASTCIPKMREAERG